jgi:hypothetical protein
MKKKKSGKKNKQRGNHKILDEPAELKKAPHTFVIHRGLSCKIPSNVVKQLLTDSQLNLRSIHADTES